MDGVRKDRDIDGGWGWIVVLSSSIVMMFILGMDFSLGPYFIELQRYFDASSVDIAWIMSLAWAVKLSVGPLANILTRRYGTRPVVMTAGMLSTLGLLSCSFVSKLSQLYLCYGVFTAFSLGLIFAPTTSMIGEYFEKKYALANGMAFMGTGIGNFILPLLFQTLIVTYGWKGSFLIVAGINANICVCGALFRPKRVKKTEPASRDEGHDDDQQRPYGTFLENLGHKCDSVCSDLDFALFRDSKMFGVEVISAFLMSFGLFSTTIHIAPRAVFLGLNANQAAVITSSFGIAGIVSRMHGVIVDKNVISALNLYRLCLVLAGISSLCSPLLTTFSGCIAHGIALGFCQGVYLPLYNVVLRNTVGQDRFISAFGIVTGSMVIGVLTGAPLAGWIFDFTGNYHYSYMMGGTFFIASAAVTIVINFLEQPHQNEERHNGDKGNVTRPVCGKIVLIAKSRDNIADTDSVDMLNNTCQVNKVKTVELTEFDIEI